ncbi:molybdopterin-guanine dinucleotide biosynthesis protein MobA [Geomonas sp. Red276]
MFMIDVTAVEPLEDRNLKITFEDGLTATVNVDLVTGKFEGVFAPLLEPDFFRRVTVDREIGTIIWPNGADVCPDVLYSFASGKPIVIDGERVLN